MKNTCKSLILRFFYSIKLNSNVIEPLCWSFSQSSKFPLHSPFKSKVEFGENIDFFMCFSYILHSCLLFIFHIHTSVACVFLIFIQHFHTCTRMSIVSEREYVSFSHFFKGKKNFPIQLHFSVFTTVSTSCWKNFVCSRQNWKIQSFVGAL